MLWPSIIGGKHSMNSYSVAKISATRVSFYIGIECTEGVSD
jgi:hypothetical protein